MLTSKTVWSEAPRWEMAHIHIIFLELFERAYLVSLINDGGSGY
jgi:hypothetical protein